MKLKKRQTLSDKEIEKIYDDLQQVRNLDKKEKYKYHNHDDLDYSDVTDRKFI